MKSKSWAYNLYMVSPLLQGPPWLYMILLTFLSITNASLPFSKKCPPNPVLWVQRLQNSSVMKEQKGEKTKRKEWKRRWNERGKTDGKRIERRIRVRLGEITQMTLLCEFWSAEFQRNKRSFLSFAYCIPSPITFQASIKDNMTPSTFALYLELYCRAYTWGSLGRP